MAFKNEKISEQDCAWVATLVNYDSIRAIAARVHRFAPPDSIWAADRDRNAYLIQLGGRGSPDDEGRMPYVVLIADGHVVLFNTVVFGTGGHSEGIRRTVEVHNLIIPLSLESRREEVTQLIREGLIEDAFCCPFVDGGTRAKPNLTARWNIKSYSVEFK